MAEELGDTQVLKGTFQEPVPVSGVIVLRSCTFGRGVEVRIQRSSEILVPDGASHLGIKEGKLVFLSNKGDRFVEVDGFPE